MIKQPYCYRDELIYFRQPALLKFERQQTMGLHLRSICCKVRDHMQRAVISPPNLLVYYMQSYIIQITRINPDSFTVEQPPSRGRPCSTPLDRSASLYDERCCGAT